jgi:hypothetical protein
MCRSACNRPQRGRAAAGSGPRHSTESLAKAEDSDPSAAGPTTEGLLGGYGYSEPAGQFTDEPQQEFVVVGSVSGPRRCPSYGSAFSQYSSLGTHPGQNVCVLGGGVFYREHPQQVDCFAGRSPSECRYQLVGFRDGVTE